MQTEDEINKLSNEEQKEQFNVRIERQSPLDNSYRCDVITSSSYGVHTYYTNYEKIKNLDTTRSQIFDLKRIAYLQYQIIKKKKLLIIL